jgi:uncharacterized protein (DUF427 family)
MSGAAYPSTLVQVDHTEPVPRRIRAMVGGHTVLDTMQAMYVWEWAGYPQYYIPLADVAPGYLIDQDRTQHLKRGIAHLQSLRVGAETRVDAARLYTESAIPGLAGMVRFEWSALDSWYEEDERVFVHPRSPYVRVDALRSTRTVRIELEGLLLAESSSPVMVFETGLPTRYYLNRTDVAMASLIATDTVSECPYKGTTSGYWSVPAPSGVRADIAWSYDFPTRQLLPIAGMIAFYNEKVDTFVDGIAQERPITHFA